METRWSYLSDKELLTYRDLLPKTSVGVNVEPAMGEELFNRLETKIEEEHEDFGTMRDELDDANEEISSLRNQVEELEDQVRQHQENL